MMPPTELLWLLLPWSLAFVFLGRLRACPPSTEPLPERTGEHPRVSIIVPARNEVERLPRLLESLRGQDLSDCELIVVDDNSTDGTAELAQAAGAITLRVEELAEGWLGKPHACWLGARAARGEVLMFLDADVELEPGGLQRILAAHARHGGLLSVQPYHSMERAYERLSAFFFLIMMGSIRSFTLAGDRLRANGSFGPCILCSREDYFRAGGHCLVRAEIIDDVALGLRMREQGLRLTNFIGEGSIRFRMYPHGIRDLADGWTKNLASGAMTTGPWMLLLITTWVAGAVATLDALRGWPVEGLSNWVVAGALAYLAYAAQLWWLLRRLGNFGLFTALSYPLSLAFFIAIFFRSLYRTLVRNSVRWKDRTIVVRQPG